MNGFKHFYILYRYTNLVVTYSYIFVFEFNLRYISTIVFNTTKTIYKNHVLCNNFTHASLMMHQKRITCIMYICIL